MGDITKLRKKVARALAASKGAKTVMFQDITNNALEVIKSIEVSNTKLVSSIEKLQALMVNQDLNVTVETGQITEDVVKQLEGVLSKINKAPTASKPVSYVAKFDRDRNGDMGEVRLDPVSASKEV